MDDTPKQIHRRPPNDFAELRKSADWDVFLQNYISSISVRPAFNPSLVQIVESPSEILRNFKSILPDTFPIITGHRLKNETWLNQNHIKLICRGDFIVSWNRSDERYFLFYLFKDFVYLIDDDGKVFKLKNLYFTSKYNMSHGLYGIVLDGEFVVDSMGNQTFNIIDIVSWYGSTNIQNENYQRRLTIIKESILNPRENAISKGLWNRNIEPFNLQLKPHWSIKNLHFLLRCMLRNQHLITDRIAIHFRSTDPSYLPKPKKLIKWIFPCHMRAQFRLIFVTNYLRNILVELCVSDFPNPFARIKAQEEFMHCDRHVALCALFNKIPRIIQCNHQESAEWRHDHNRDFYESFLNAVDVDELLQIARSRK